MPVLTAAGLNVAPAPPTSRVRTYSVGPVNDFAPPRIRRSSFVWVSPTTVTAPLVDSIAASAELLFAHSATGSMTWRPATVVVAEPPSSSVIVIVTG
jgi:hypothetical protein